MNILHINSTDYFGQRFTGYLAQQQMLDKTAHHVAMAVWLKKTKNLNIHKMKYRQKGWFWGVHNVGWRMSNWFALEGLFCPVSFLLPSYTYFRYADVVHLHLLHDENYFSIFALPKLSQCKPIVWTLHDSWPITGGCVYSFECERWLTGCKGRCPHPRGNSIFSRFSPALYWQIKRMIYQRIPINLVVASKWMQDRVQRSPLLRHLPCDLIPYGIDLNIFHPKSKDQCRKKFGIRSDETVLAFRAFPVENDLYKGVKWLKEALTLFKPRKPTSLLIFQDGSDFQSLSSKYKVIDVGWIDNDSISDVFCAADLFLMPSVQEAFGLMTVESMACGTPVVVFEGTALPDVIHAPQGGIAVPLKDSVALAGAIDQLLTDNDLRNKLSHEGRRIAEREYSSSLHVHRHIKLYEAIVESHTTHNQYMNP